MVVILTSFSTTFTLSPELEKDTYDIGILPYCPLEKCKGNEYKKLTQFSYVQLLKAVKSGCSIILLDQNPITLQLLKEMHEGIRKPTNHRFDISNWKIISFIHDDEALKNTGILVMPDTLIDPAILLREKNKDLERISANPFIKRVIIPYNFQITENYLIGI